MGDGGAGERDASPPRLCGLAAGHALTLRARRLSVLRISHGRVWLTLTDGGPWSRVRAGDHFLSPGESLTLLPGQELVMEPFGLADGAPAQFTWDEPGAEAAAVHVPRVPVLSPAALWRGSVVEPLLDLRHAAGLAARATGRLAVGLGRLAGAVLVLPGTVVAMIFVAAGAGKTRSASALDAENHAAAAPCRLT
jgi:hypothetical protein